MIRVNYHIHVDSMTATQRAILRDTLQQLREEEKGDE